MSAHAPRPLLAKLGVKDDARALFVDAPAEAIEAIGLPERQRAQRLQGLFDCIHLFVRMAAELDERFPRLKAHLQPTGALWVSWPKGGGQGTDLSLQKIIAIGYRHGLVESKTIAIDATWSAIKFTVPKPGKTYRNSYGRLPTATATVTAGKAEA